MCVCVCVSGMSCLHARTMYVYVSECVCFCQCEWVWTLGVLGELASHKRSLTHRPSSQGWAPCVLLFCCLFVCFMGWGFLGFLSPPFCLFASVLYTYNSMYIYLYM